MFIMKVPMKSMLNTSAGIANHAAPNLNYIPERNFTFKITDLSLLNL